jgi:transcriptional regulator with XRE-family HTH domain
MDARKLVGWNLRKLRVERGLTIEDLAGEAETEYSYTAKVERGTVNVSLDLLERFAAVLEVPLRTLFAEVKPGSAPPKPLKAGRRPKTVKR